MTTTEHRERLRDADRDLLTRIAAARRMLYNEGCDSQTAGHVSVRVDGEDAFWVNVFEYMDETTPERVIKVSFDLEVLDGGGGTAAPAISFHAAIYRARPDVRSIVHHHGHHTSVIASTGQPIGMFNVLSYILYDEQAYIVDEEQSNTADDERIPECLGEKSVLLMKNHGAIVVGSTLEETVVKAMFLEKAAQYHYECTLVGGTELVDENQLRNYKRLSMEHVVPTTWDAQFRRLRRSDPEVFV
jgi:L-fuculose-phosphate aldolase